MLMGAWMQLVNMLLRISGKGDGSRRPNRFDGLAMGEEELSANMGLRLLFILEGTPPPTAPATPAAAIRAAANGSWPVRLVAFRIYSSVLAGALRARVYDAQTSLIHIANTVIGLSPSGPSERHVRF